MALAHTLGFPRIGTQRELKFALESFWRQDIDENALRAVAHQIRAQNWQRQVDAGLDFVTVGDFAYYDHVLHTLALLGALPSRFQIDPQQLSLSDYFVLARGNQQHVAMEMTKWFDTNYHYLVPEWTADSRFDGGVDWLFEDIQQAQAAGFNSKVVLIGPLTLLHLGKIKSGLTHALDLLPSVIAAYQKLLTRLQQHGIQWVQIDEPILALELDQQWLAAFVPTYQSLVSASSDLPQAQPQLILATYFDGIAEHLDLLNTLPIAGIHIDAVRAPEQLAQFAAQWPSDKILSIGIVDGRNIWRADLDLALSKLTAL
ncbi:MAG: 5-methyltetrahydropteroyltriglutamate--homocysteine S-methyltransferase, partial [Burkholderiaceae bacterium]|nr:5-methyltetrahydropteroyltriglutamate--homocysteine S-methyltransferase [Burkholderiaceae bacterium]